MTTYERIVFIQNPSEYDEAMAEIEASGEEFGDAAVAYLAQWDNGDGGDRGYAETAAGSSDYTLTVGDYIVTWNERLCYIGLERIERDA